LAAGCKKCPAFKFCPLTTVLGDQGVGSRGWNFPRADEHPDSEEELEKNKNEESKKE